MKSIRFSKAIAVFTVLALALAVIGLPNIALANVTSVSITPGSDASIVAGGTLDLTGVINQDGTTTGTGYEWSTTGTGISFSSTTTAATTITGLTAGSSNLVTFRGYDDEDTTGDTASLTVTVLTMGISDTAVTLTGGTTHQLSASNVLTGSVSWNSDNTNVATVDATGLVTAVGAGTATITATSTPGGGADTQTRTCVVTVNPIVTLSPASQTITAASTSANVTLSVQYGGDLIPSSSTVSWANSNSTVGTLTASSSTFTETGGVLYATATFTSTSAGTEGTSTITATINGSGYTNSQTANVTVRTARYLTLEGPSSLDNTSRTGLYTVRLHEADGTIVNDNTSTVHWSWSSSYLSITSNSLNDYRADMHSGEAHIELYARYNTPSAGTRLYTWINDDYDERIYHTITITGLSSLPQTGQDFTLAYVFGGLGGALLIATGVWYGIRKKRTEKA
jgi:LPXTG-motif cell wall-anchored protein